MKKYIDPQFELITLSTSDAITNSYGGENGDFFGYDKFDEGLSLLAN